METSGLTSKGQTHGREEALDGSEDLEQSGESGGEVGVLFNRSVTIVIIKACVLSAVSAGLCLLLVGQFVTDRQYCWVGFGNLFLGLFSTYMYMYTKIGVNQKQKKILGRVQRL